jgi:tRNA(Ile)-lysidine synthase
MAHLFSEEGLTFGIAHCNFNLRGNESNLDADFVKNMAESKGIPFYSTNFDTKEYAAAHGISIQMAARELRYQWLEEIRNQNNYQYIATAHHLDDQAETILINLIRGTGIAGLHGIPVKTGALVRPLMFARRGEIAMYAAQNAIAFREDQSNSETKYLRNKIRHEIIPLMTSINPDFTGNLSSFARKISDYENIAMNTLTDWKRKATLCTEDETVVDITRLKSLGYPEALAWFILSPFGFNESQVSDILKSLSDPEEKRFNTTTHYLSKERNRLVIKKHHEHTSRAQQIEVGAGVSEISNPLHLNFRIITNPESYDIPKQNNFACLDYNKLDFPLTIRRPEPGDSFHPLGMKGKKKISDFFTDLKFSQQQKGRTWLLCSGNQIVWVIGHRIDHRFRVTDKTATIFEIFLANFANH